MRKKIEQEKDLKIDEIDQQLETLEKRKKKIFNFTHKLFKFESVSSTMSIVALVAVFHIGLVFYAFLIGSMARLVASMTYRLHLSFKLTKTKRQISELKTKKFQKLSAERAKNRPRKYSKLKPFGTLRRKNLYRANEMTQGQEISFATNKAVYQERISKTHIATQAFQPTSQKNTQIACKKHDSMER